MADLPEAAEWVPGIFQLETNTPALGGADGYSNRQARQLANRTRYLKERVDQLEEDVPKLNAAGLLDAGLVQHRTRVNVPHGTVLKSSETDLALWTTQVDDAVKLTATDSPPAGRIFRVAISLDSPSNCSVAVHDDADQVLARVHTSGGYQASWCELVFDGNRWRLLSFGQA